MANQTIEELWKLREAKVLQTVRDDLDYYIWQTRRSYRSHKYFSVTLLTLAVIAPLFVVSSSDTTFPGCYLGKETISIIAILITTAVALMQGLQKLFRFDQRWIMAYTSREELKRARETYRRDRIDLDIGSTSWKQNLERLDQARNRIADADTKSYFASFLQAPK